MDRKKKLRIVQLCLISIGILTLIFTYSDKINLHESKYKLKGPTKRVPR